ncbi:MAG: YitT family protein [Lachnospiraceae bacterium]|nr:YitT family protein [Lachnospiraceae bacterium]MBR5508930.1 YitT family protein [Lachnospiraceae bacterium]
MSAISTRREWLIRLCFLTLGLIIAHLGVTLFLISDLGTDTFTVFASGISHTAGISVGLCHSGIQCILIILMILFTKGYIKTGSFICCILGGPIIDIFNWLLGRFVSSASPMPIRFVTMTLGCVILSIGMALVIASDAGTGPNDLVAVILTDKLKKFQFRTVRICCDLFFITAGFLLGGTVGIGTIVAAFLVGPIVQIFRPIHEKNIQNLFM